jgi:aminoglycoside 6-adenylyltransferase
MTHPIFDDPFIQRLIQWAEARESVRAMLLTSTLAVPSDPVDLFSDYDVVLALTDIRPYAEDRAWLEDFGRVLALYRDPIQLEDGFEQSANVTQYEDGLKIDFTLWPVGLLQQIVAAPQLPDEFDAGYVVLLDKDGLTQGMKPPTYQAYIPKPPTETQYHNKIEELFLDAGYVAKFLWRDDLMAAKFILDHMIKQEYLLPMLEWHAEINHQWTVKPGPYGRRLKRWLRPDLWADLESTYVGAGTEENWAALFKSVDLMRKVALEVGDHLGFTYPDDLHRRLIAYLQRVKNLARNAQTFS